MNCSMMNAAESLKILVLEIFETRDAAPGTFYQLCLTSGTVCCFV